MENQRYAFDNDGIEYAITHRDKEEISHFYEPRETTSANLPEREAPNVTKAKVTAMIENGTFSPYRHSWLNMVPGRLLDIANKELETSQITR